MPAQDDYDVDDLRTALEPWLSDRIGTAATIIGLDAPGESGFSSETLLLDVSLGGEDERVEHLVIKTMPMGFRVFPDYDMSLQYDCMRLVREHSDSPVPTVRWFEGDDAVLGRPFYVMDRVDALVPPDNLPYTMHGFLYDATPAQQRHLDLSAIEAMAGLHGIDAEAAGFRFLDRGSGDGVDQQLDYYEGFLTFATDGEPNAPLEEGLAWLRANKPAGLTDGLSWGDSRIGNIMFVDFEPVAILDWEMAWWAPPEQDVAWFFYFQRFFSTIIGLPDLPGFPSEEEGIAHYVEVSGRPLADLDWFFAWAAFRYSVIMVRLMHRSGAGHHPDDWTFTDNPIIESLNQLTGHST